jgi:hypothetical protein
VLWGLPTDGCIAWCQVNGLLVQLCLTASSHMTVLVCCASEGNSGRIACTKSGVSCLLQAVVVEQEKQLQAMLF